MKDSRPRLKSGPALSPGRSVERNDLDALSRVAPYTRLRALKRSITYDDFLLYLYPSRAEGLSLQALFDVIRQLIQELFQVE